MPYICAKMISMEVVSFIAKKQSPLQGKSVAWRSPSNIALVKYWGKYAPQMPANPSLSFTLDNCNTKTTVTLRNRDTLKQSSLGDFSFDFSFEGAPKPDFHPKILSFFERVAAYLPFLKQYHFSILSENTFPHSSGIASSASAMAALSLCLLELSGEFLDHSEAFKAKASFLARLGSGSAARSIQGPLMQWGKTDSIPYSEDLIAIVFKENIAVVFNSYQDTILLVDKGTKVVSSTQGHGLMENHPYAAARFNQAHKQIAALSQALKTGDIDTFIYIVEQEALTLHAMMLTSSPYFILMKPATLAIIEKVWAYRAATKIPLCFTLDAGANVHLLYPEKYKGEVLQFIENELVVYCENAQYICDIVGAGSVSVSI